MKRRKSQLGNVDRKGNCIVFTHAPRTILFYFFCKIFVNTPITLGSTIIMKLAKADLSRIIQLCLVCVSPFFIFFFDVKVMYVRARRVARVRRNEVRSLKSFAV